MSVLPVRKGLAQRPSATPVRTPSAQRRTAPFPESKTAGQKANALCGMVHAHDRTVPPRAPVRCAAVLRTAQVPGQRTHRRLLEASTDPRGEVGCRHGTAPTPEVRAQLLATFRPERAAGRACDATPGGATVWRWAVGEVEVRGTAELHTGLTAADPAVAGARKGRRSAPGTPLIERMMRLTDVNPDGCWLWTGAVAGKGYGVINVAGRLTKAHRVSYELHVGPIPDGLVIDHLCRTPLCVRPDHLEPVTVRENTLRGEGPSAKAAQVTECPQGHPYDEANTRIDRGARFCRRCKNDYSNRWYARHRAAAKEAS